MIRYSLQCGAGHIFDEWFSNSGDYDAQAAAQSIACPDCGDRAVRKAIMAPNVAKAAAAPAPTPCGAMGCGAAGGPCAFNDL